MMAIPFSDYDGFGMSWAGLRVYKNSLTANFIHNVDVFCYSPSCNIALKLVNPLPVIFSDASRQIPTSPMKRHRHRKGQPGVVHFRRRSREGRGLADGLQCQPVEQKLPARPGNLGRDERALAVDAEADGDGAGSARPAGAGGEDAVP